MIYVFVLNVTDNRPGISAEEKERGFERFYRSKVGRESGQPRIGLGLSIVKEIVGRHNGLVEVQSEGIPGRGATFMIWLPMAGKAE
jgi:signal transduction histidine kinase